MWNLPVNLENNIFGYGIWSHHIKPMLSIANRLAVEYQADPEIVMIAVLLDDLAGISDKEKIEEHHIHGAKEAVKIVRTIIIH